MIMSLMIDNGEKAQQEQECEVDEDVNAEQPANLEGPFRKLPGSIDPPKGCPLSFCRLFPD